MADDFNPYHVWLSIRPEEQPPNHYRLLGLPLFETSGDVIDSAADRQMAHLRTFQSGKHGELTQRLLNEVAAARVCLLDPKKRAVYDQQLRAKSPAAPAASAPISAPAAVSGSAIQRQPLRRPGPLPTVAPAPAPNMPVATALPQPANDWDDLLGDPTAKPASRSAGKSPGANAAKASAAKRAAKNRNISIGIAAAVLLIAAAGIGWLALNGSSSEGTLVFDWPSDEKADTTVTVDEVPLPAPASGAWEYHGPAGSHHIVALRPAYKIDATVALAAGQRQTAPADWKPKAVLALSWPLSQRAGAELKIDGRTHAVTRHDPLEIAVEPGLHVVQITRPNSAPLVRSATVAPDGRALVAIAPPPPSATKLVFDWPADQRKDAELIVDGSKQSVPNGSDSASFALVVAPGRRAVHITRTGFEPFKAEVDLAAGQKETVKPTWTPVQSVATTALEAQPAVETPAEQPEKKLPIPPAAEQEKIAKQLDDLYKSSHSGSKDPAKAQELFDLAAKAGASSAERYVLLVKGAELAAAAGDLKLSLQGVDSLDAEFEIDALEAKQKLLDKFVSAGKAEQVDAATPIAEQLMDQAVAADRYPLAIEFSMTASRAATKSKSPTRKEIDERLSHRRHEIHVLEPFFAAAKTAQETLAKNPADAEANSNLGRWLCFYKNDWSAGLPLLAKGDDEKLKSLAEQELKAPTDAEQQAHLADAWWELASKESGIARDSIHLHAGEIYQAASPNLTSALRKAAIEKRLTEIADLKPAVATSGAIDSADAGKTAGGSEFPLNKWVDVLRFVDTTKNVVGGKWSRAGKEIDVAPSGEARIAIPVVVDGGYDLAVAFNRVQGSGEVRISVPVGSHACNFEWGLGADSGLDILDGHRPNDDSNPTKVTSHDIGNGRAYQVLIRVRLLGTDRASVDVLMDGKQFLPHWEGNPAVLAVHGYWTMPTPNHLGFGAWNSQVAFGVARLRMVSGQASFDGSVVEKPIRQPAPSVVSSNKTAGAAKFPLNQWVDVLRLVDTTRDRVNGTWLSQGTELLCKSSFASRVELPVVVDGGYDFEVEFTRTSGSDLVAAALSVGSHKCIVGLSGWKGGVSGLMNVDGREALDAKNLITVRPGPLENGHRYQLLAKVRILEKGTASVDVSLDGKPYLPHWQGDPAALSSHWAWKMPHSDRLGLGATYSEVTFHSARLRMVSGSASLDPAVSGNH